MFIFETLFQEYPCLISSGISSRRHALPPRRTPRPHTDSPENPIPPGSDNPYRQCRHRYDDDLPDSILLQSPSPDSPILSAAFALPPVPPAPAAYRRTDRISPQPA